MPILCIGIVLGGHNTIFAGMYCLAQYDGKKKKSSVHIHRNILHDVSEG
jgi:hypothetical protein